VTDAPPRGVVALLTAQALAFGVTLALLIVPANSLFLDEYGSQWLPVTYIAIAVAGTAVAGLFARAARTTRLVRLAAASLGGLALLYAGSWVLLEAGASWISGVLLVTFPVALQIGFVLVGGQAGRLLDVRQMKEQFPRVVSGFAVGFLVGGLLGIPLLALLGSTEDLLLATTAAQLAFLVLLILTERRFPEVRTTPATAAPEVARPPLRTLFGGLVALLLAYQVLSAAGSELVNFLFFDRAAARHSGEDLTRFLAAYTAILNLVDILFLALLAGPLTRRFGLRLGLTLNPAVVAGVLALMAVVAAGPGTGSFALFALAGVLRIADIAATDGTTRTSINVAYQVVDDEERLAVQAVVEGVGVPVAIGGTGVLLLVLDALGLGVGTVIVVGLLLSAAWTLVALAAHRAYVRSLAGAMRARPLTAAGVLDDEAPAMRALLRSDDARDVRLGLDLLAGVLSPAPEAELRRIAAGADPGLRVRAQVQLAAGGDERARVQLAATTRELASSPAASDRCAAALALAGEVPGRDRGPLAALLADAEPAVRSRALEAVAPADADRADVVGLAVAAVEDPRTAGPAMAAIARLGDAAVPSLAAALEREGAGRRLPLVRAAATAAAVHGAGIVAPALGDPDRSVVLAALDALDRAGGHGALEPALLDRVLDDAVALAAHAAAARGSLAGGDGALARALDDEVELARRLVIAVLALRHGERVRAAVRVVDHAQGSRRALGVEALDVLLSRAEAAVALALVRRDPGAGGGAAPVRTRAEWLDDLVGDPDARWRSPWLAACAAAAASPPRSLDLG